MSSATRGNQGEAMILAAFVSRGFDVSVPFGGGQPYDLVVDLGEAGFLRVQCKMGWESNGCVAFNCRATDHGRGRQPYLGLADIFGVYFPSTRSVYLVPVTAVPGFKGHLRLGPTRNNQRKGVRFAFDFEIDQWSREGLRRLVSGVRLKLIENAVELSSA
ncbi:MAG: group I intron-associated PD-(D/E)XK endonuclease [Solirubrobacterales bacterium]